MTIYPDDLTDIFRSGQMQGFVAGVAVSIVAYVFVKQNMKKIRRKMEHISVPVS
jgi:hypothetical protein